MAWWTYIYALASLIYTSSTSTLDDSHRTGTTEMVQAIKGVEENNEDSKEMKIWDQTMYLSRK